MSSLEQDGDVRMGRQPGGRIARRIIAGMILLGVIGTSWWLVTRPARVIMPIPQIDLESCPPAVAKSISRAVKAVERQPDSGEAWGYLGMMLFAHQFELETNQCLEQAANLAPEDYRWPYLLGLNQSVSDRRAAAEQWRDIGVSHRYFVEFGAWDGMHWSNTANLRLHLSLFGSGPGP